MTATVNTTFPGAELIMLRAQEARIGWRRFSDVSVETPGRLFAHVVKGRIVSFGVEPVGDAIVTLDGITTAALDGARGQLDRVRVGVVAGAATFGAALVGAAGGFVVHRRGR